MDNNSLNNLLLTIVEIWLLVSCVLIVVVIAAAFLAFRWLQRFVRPDMAVMERKVRALRAANPRMSTDALVRRIIRQQAFKAGVIGALTGLGGFITLPIALPVDLVASLRIQATMVQFIAMLYGHGTPSPEESKLQTYLVMTGGAEVTEAGFEFIMRLVVRFLGESLADLVPVIGAVVGFGVNYVIAQATGNAAMRWYARGQRQPLLQQPN